MVQKSLRKKQRLYDYNAFISYSHAADAKLAPAIQSALHQFARPWYRMRALRVFRDQTSLAANPGLWVAIEKALNTSEWFLFMASPRAAQSAWVQREIEWWLDHRSSSKMLILLTEGDIDWCERDNDYDWSHTTALPQSLGGRFKGEPLYVDLRTLKRSEQLSLRNSAFHDAILNIAAPLHDQDKDELEGEDVRQYRRFRKIRCVVITSLVLLTMTAMLFAGLSYWQRDKAMENEINALLESSENALLASKQLEALIAAVKAGKQLQELNSGLRNWVKPIYDTRGEAESESKSVTVLHRVLSEIREKNRLQGHSDRINRVVFSPNCHGLEPHLASASEDCTVKLWRRDGTLLRSLSHEGAVTDVAFSPDCRILASTSFNGEIRFWNREGENIEKKSDENSLTSVSFSADGRLVAWGNDAGHVMFETPLGEDFKRIEANKRGAIHVSFSPICPDGGEFLLSASENRVDTERIKIWSLDSRLIQALAGHTDKVTNAAISPDCTMIATVSNDKNLLLWKRDGREYILDKTLNGHTGPITDVDFSPDNQMIVFSGESDVSSPTDKDNIIRVWNREGVEIVAFKGHNAPVTSVSFSPDGQTIASTSGDNSVRLWNPNEIPVRETIQGNGDALRGVFSPHGDKLVVTLEDNSLDLWDLSSGKHKTFKTEGDSIPKVINDPNGDFFTLDLHNKALRTLVGKRVMVFKDDIGKRAAISFSPDKQLIASSSDRNTITLWTGDGKPIERFDGYSKSNKTLRFSPDGKSLAFLAAKDQQHSVVLRRIGTPNPIALPKQKGAINDISFSPGSNMLATAGEDHLINLWHIDSRGVKTLSGHGAAVTSVIFHPNGKMLASAGYDDKIKLWTRNGRELLSLAGSPNIWDIAFAQNGNQLVAVAQDGGLMRWNFDPDDLLRRACHWLIDYLQTNEVLRKEDKTICTPKD